MSNGVLLKSGGGVGKKWIKRHFCQNGNGDLLIVATFPFRFQTFLGKQNTFLKTSGENLKKMERKLTAGRTWHEEMNWKKIIRKYTHTLHTQRREVSIGQRLRRCVCRDSTRRRSVGNWTTSGDLSAGYIAAPKIETDIIGRHADWLPPSDQDVSSSLSAGGDWLAAGLWVWPTSLILYRGGGSGRVSNTQRPIFPPSFVDFSRGPSHFTPVSNKSRNFIFLPNKIETNWMKNSSFLSGRHVTWQVAWTTIVISRRLVHSRDRRSFRP